MGGLRQIHGVTSKVTAFTALVRGTRITFAAVDPARSRFRLAAAAAAGT